MMQNNGWENYMISNVGFNTVMLSFSRKRTSDTRLNVPPVRSRDTKPNGENSTTDLSGNPVRK